LADATAADIAADREEVVWTATTPGVFPPPTVFPREAVVEVPESTPSTAVTMFSMQAPVKAVPAVPKATASVHTAETIEKSDVRGRPWGVVALCEGDEISTKEAAELWLSEGCGGGIEGGKPLG